MTKFKDLFEGKTKDTQKAADAFQEVAKSEFKTPIVKVDVGKNTFKVTFKNSKDLQTAKDGIMDAEGNASKTWHNNYFPEFSNVAYTGNVLTISRKTIK